MKRLFFSTALLATITLAENTRFLQDAPDNQTIENQSVRGIETAKEAISDNQQKAFNQSAEDAKINETNAIKA